MQQFVARLFLLAGEDRGVTQVPDLTSAEFDQLLADIGNLKVDDKTLESLNVISQTIEGADRFIKSLLKRQLASGMMDEAAVESAEQILANIGEKSDLLACIFLAHLMPAANDLILHHVCDSIDLWCFHNQSPELSRHLLLLADAQSDERLRRHYQQMASNSP